MSFDFTDNIASIEVDIFNLGKAYKNIDNLQSAIEIGIKNGMSELAIRTEEKIQEQLSIFGLGGSSMASNITISPHENGVEIFMGSDYAVYVEYGTGIVGEMSPHPHPWEYDINGHGEEGWVFKSDDGNWYRTKGQMSHPFMYNTWLWASRSAVNIINKNIRQECAKVGVK